MSGNQDAQWDDSLAWWHQQDCEMQRREDDVEMELVYDPLYAKWKEYETLRNKEMKTCH
jgi:hypothetical protein